MLVKNIVLAIFGLLLFVIPSAGSFTDGDGDVDENFTDPQAQVESNGRGLGIQPKIYKSHPANGYVIEGDMCDATDISTVLPQISAENDFRSSEKFLHKFSFPLSAFQADELEDILKTKEINYLHEIKPRFDDSFGSKEPPYPSKRVTNAAKSLLKGSEKNVLLIKWDFDCLSNLEEKLLDLGVGDVFATKETVEKTNNTFNPELVLDTMHNTKDESTSKHSTDRKSRRKSGTLVLTRGVLLFDTYPENIALEKSHARTFGVHILAKLLNHNLEITDIGRIMLQANQHLNAKSAEQVLTETKDTSNNVSKNNENKYLNFCLNNKQECIEYAERMIVDEKKDIAVASFYPFVDVDVVAFSNYKSVLESLGAKNLIEYLNFTADKKAHQMNEYNAEIAAGDTSASSAVSSNDVSTSKKFDEDAKLAKGLASCIYTAENDMTATPTNDGEFTLLGSVENISGFTNDDRNEKMRKTDEHSARSNNEFSSSDILDQQEDTESTVKARSNADGIRGRAIEDPMFRLQWHLQGSEGHFTLAADRAWELMRTSTTPPTKPPVVALFDTGCASHEEIEGRIWRNKGEISCSDNTDEDGNGYVDDCYGWNFVEDTPDVRNDTYGHGTAMAGLISANFDEKGGRGVWQHGVVMCLKVGDRSGVRLSRQLRAMDYMVHKGAEISVFPHTLSTYSETYFKAFERLNQLNHLAIVSAGNMSCNIDTDKCVSYPASFKFPEPSNVLVIGGSTYSGDKTRSSNWGQKSVHAFAPAYRLMTANIHGLSPVENPYCTNCYALVEGTSFAAALAAGTAASLWAELTHQGVFTRESAFESVDIIDESGIAVYSQSPSASPFYDVVEPEEQTPEAPTKHNEPPNEISEKDIISRESGLDKQNQLIKNDPRKTTASLLDGNKNELPRTRSVNAAHELSLLGGGLPSLNFGSRIKRASEPPAQRVKKGMLYSVSQSYRIAGACKFDGVINLHAALLYFESVTPPPFRRKFPNGTPFYPRKGNEN